MTDTPTPESAPAKPARKSGGALGGKVLAELQEIAAGLGISGAKKMRKGELIDAIKAARGESSPVAPQAAPSAETPAEQAADAPAAERPARARRGRQQTDGQDQGADASADEGRQERADRDQGRQDRGQQRDDQGGQREQGRRGDKQQDKAQNDRGQQDKSQNDRGQDDRSQGDKGQQGRQQGDKNQADKNQGDRDRSQNDRNQGDKGGQQGRGQQDRQHEDDDEGGRRRNRRGRNRGGRGADGEPTYSDDDVLVPAAGILDILDNYAFVRTTGYLPSENDVYVSLSMVRKWGLRKGDAVTGQVRQPRDGERKEKFNPMVRVDTVNGMPLEEARGRVDFDRLVPLFADERLPLETVPGDLTTRVIDLVAPIGKGQRGLVVSPSQAGKTVAVQSIANAITTNNPECHLMVVLVDERPEEVTEMQRSVKGEVIASTFDRPASDHTTVAELAIERAKRLVELGHDVVVLLDSLTRLGRAYQQNASASARVVGAGVDPAALHPAKTFFGAARNVEDGGSLTILAAALVESGSGTDEIILEEFTGASTMELRLRGDLARKQLFPAIDVTASSTRREELLLEDDELALVRTLRRLLATLEPQQALELVLEGLGRTATNAEFLLGVPRLPGADAL